jgi:hypothetical protein
VRADDPEKAIDLRGFVEVLVIPAEALLTSSM